MYISRETMIAKEVMTIPAVTLPIMPALLVSEKLNMQSIYIYYCDHAHNYILSQVGSPDVQVAVLPMLAPDDAFTCELLSL